MPKKLLDDEDRPKSERDRERPEREPISWRDRDRKKDRSQHTTPDTRDRTASASPQNRFLAERERKSNLAAANALFASNPKETLKKKILAAPVEELAPLIDEYIEKHGYPDTFDVLARFAEHPSGDVVKSALRQLEPMLASASAADKEKLLQSLKLVSMMGVDPVARRAAASLIRRKLTTDVST